MRPAGAEFERPGEPAADAAERVRGCREGQRHGKDGEHDDPAHRGPSLGVPGSIAGGQAAAGGMLCRNRNTLSGSYVRLTARSRGRLVA